MAKKNHRPNSEENVPATKSTPTDTSDGTGTPGREQVTRQPDPRRAEDVEISAEVKQVINLCFSPLFVKIFLGGFGVLTLIAGVLLGLLTWMAKNSLDDLETVKTSVNTIKGWGDIPKQLQDVSAKIPSVGHLATKEEVSALREQVKALAERSAELKDQVKQDSVINVANLKRAVDSVIAASNQIVTREEFAKFQDAVHKLQEKIDEILPTRLARPQVVSVKQHSIRLTRENIRVVDDDTVEVSPFLAGPKSLTATQLLVVTNIELKSTNRETVFPTFESTFDVKEGTYVRIELAVSAADQMAKFLDQLTSDSTSLSVKVELLDQK